MSEKVLVSVFDKVSQLYSPVLTEVNRDSAVRNFKIGAKQNAQISACPQDYELRFLGYFNDETGCVYSQSEPEILFEAKDLFPAE
nr:MAG TPA: DNA binding protein [Microviridae sp.]